MTTESAEVETPTARETARTAGRGQPKKYLVAIVLNMLIGFATSVLVLATLPGLLVYVTWAAATWVSCRVIGLHGWRAHILVYIASLLATAAASLLFIMLFGQQLLGQI